jgi:hypothetical protein
MMPAVITLSPSTISIVDLPAVRMIRGAAMATLPGMMTLESSL